MKARMRLGGMVQALCAAIPLVAASLLSHPAHAALGFEEALSRITARSPGIEARRAELEAARSRNLPSRLHFLPSLDLVGSGTRLKADTLYENQTQAEAAARMNLFRFGADRALVQSADALEAALEARIRSELLATELAAATALLELIREELSNRILSGLADSAAESLRIAQQRYERGLMPRQEVDKVRIDLENARARLAETGIESTRARSRVLELLGTDDLTLEWPWKSRLASGKPLSFLPLAAGDSELARRPDWRSAELELESTARLKSRGWRLLLPSVDATLRAGRYFMNDPSLAYDGWQATLSVTLPLFDRLSSYSEFRARTWESAAREADLEAVRRRARGEWLSSRQTFEAALRTAVARDQTLRLSEGVYRDHQRRFQAGRMSANELAIEQQRASETALLSLNGWSAAHLELVRICHAVGQTVADCLGPSVKAAR